MVPRKITCERCGNEVIASGPSQKYCPLCAYRIRLEKQRERVALEKRRGNVAMFHEALAAARTSGKTKHIQCAKCGADVVVPVKAGRAKFCPTCAEEAKAASTKRCRTKKIRCVRCGKEAVVSNLAAQAKYCPDCGREVRKEQRKRSVKQHYERQRAQKAEARREKKTGPTIAENQRAAHAAGMSYGQYKAWLYMQEMKKGA